MPPASVPALLVLLVAVLPGSVYTWAFERQASRHGVALADRVLRFVGVSAAFALLFAWPAYGRGAGSTRGGRSASCSSASRGWRSGRASACPR